MSDTGAAQDGRFQQRYVDAVRAKHRIKQFRPPFASCKCDTWQISAPKDYGISAARDWLLDEFNKHLKAMREEKKRMALAAKNGRAIPPPQPLP